MQGEKKSSEWTVHGCRRLGTHFEKPPLPICSHSSKPLTRAKVRPDGDELERVMTENVASVVATRCYEAEAS